MPATAPIALWHWVGFIVLVTLCLGVDLGLFRRTPGKVEFKVALGWSALWISLAIAFSVLLKFWRGPAASLQFVTGYLVEFSLSLDNVVAMALVFASLGIPQERQHRVLFWGIPGVLVMRGAMIGLGVTLVRSFHWVLYLMGAFLIFTGVQWAVSAGTAVDPSRNHLLRLARKFLPVATDSDDDSFFTFSAGRRLLTPLALALLMIETADLVFALDSVPAVFAVTQDAFLIFTSNVFAILGLRSLYFAAADAIRNFRHLKTGLAIVLVLVGLKMLAARWTEVPTAWFLGGVAVILVTSILLSVRAPRPGPAP